MVYQPRSWVLPLKFSAKLRKCIKPFCFFYGYCLKFFHSLFLFLSKIAYLSFLSKGGISMHFLNWDLLHSKLSSHYEAWNYKKKKKKIISVFGLVKVASPKTLHVYSTLKRRGNGRFHFVVTWNTRGVFVSLEVTMTLNKVNFFITFNTVFYC